MDDSRSIEEYEVEAVDDCRLASHSDFLALPRVYTVRKVNSETRYRLKLPKKLGWRPGEIVQLALQTVQGHAV